ncbi:MAG: hypothetical protein Q9186_004201 [Xanthomendoza sp. 1 TL-2023]
MGSPFNYTTMQQRMAWLSDDNAKLSEENKRLRSQTDYHRKTVESLTKDTTRLRAERDDMRSQNLALTTENTDLRNKNGKLDAQIKNLTEQVKKRGRDNAALVDENRRLEDRYVACVNQRGYVVERRRKDLAAVYGRLVEYPERGRRRN